MTRPRAPSWKELPAKVRRDVIEVLASDAIIGHEASCPVNGCRATGDAFRAAIAVLKSAAPKPRGKRK